MYLSSNSNSLCLIGSNKIKQERATSRLKIQTIGIKVRNNSFLLGLIKFCKVLIRILKNLKAKITNSNLNFHNNNKVQMEPSRTNLFLSQTMPTFNLSSYLLNSHNSTQISLYKTSNCQLKEYPISFSLNRSHFSLFQPPQQPFHPNNNNPI